jgi:hypothetical protein
VLPGRSFSCIGIPASVQLYYSKVGRLAASRLT